jgi:short subunit fatty acids transporter
MDSMRVYLPIPWVVLHNLMLTILIKIQILMKQKGGKQLDFLGNYCKGFWDALHNIC